MIVHSYAPDKFFHLRSDYRLKQPLSFETVKNAMIYPAMADNNVVDFPNFYAHLHQYGFILDESGHYVLAAANHRQPLYSRSQNTVSDIPLNIDKRSGRAIYLGCYIRHWGHFLIEGISRWWPLLNEEAYRDCDLCYLIYGQQRDYMDQLAGLFGLDKSRLKRIEKPTVYDEIIIPEASSEQAHFWSEEYQKTIQKISSTIKAVPNDKIYLSRMRFSDRLLGEKAIEQTLRRNGWKIIYPEKLSIKKQIAVIKGAGEIACVSGTTAHNLIFSRQGSKCAIFERGGIKPNEVQMPLNEMNDLDISCVKASYFPLPTSSGDGPFLIGITPWMRKWLDDNKIRYKPQDCQLYKKFFSAYLRLWLQLYQKKDRIAALLFDNPGITKDQLTAIAAKVEQKIQYLSSKIYTDKHIKDKDLVCPKRFCLIRKVKKGNERFIMLCGFCICHYTKS